MGSHCVAGSLGRMHQFGRQLARKRVGFANAASVRICFGWGQADHHREGQPSTSSGGVQLEQVVEAPGRHARGVVYGVVSEIWSIFRRSLCRQAAGRLSALRDAIETLRLKMRSARLDEMSHRAYDGRWWPRSSRFARTDASVFSNVYLLIVEILVRAGLASRAKVNALALWVSGGPIFDMATRTPPKKTKKENQRGPLTPTKKNRTRGEGGETPPHPEENLFTRTLPFRALEGYVLD